MARSDGDGLGGLPESAGDRESTTGAGYSPYAALRGLDGKGAGVGDGGHRSSVGDDMTDDEARRAQDCSKVASEIETEGFGLALDVDRGGGGSGATSGDGARDRGAGADIAVHIDSVGATVKGGPRGLPGARRSGKGAAGRDDVGVGSVGRGGRGGGQSQQGEKEKEFLHGAGHPRTAVVITVSRTD